MKELMYKNGAIYASLSGSGATVYGIFDKEIDIVFSLITTIIYFILYMVCDKIFTKKEK